MDKLRILLVDDEPSFTRMLKMSLERRGFDPEIVVAIKSAFRTLFYGKLLRDDAIRQTLDEYGHLAEVRRLVDFILKSERGVVGRDRE